MILRAVTYTMATSLLVCATSRADSLTFIGASIPMRDCKVEGLRAGQIHFLDSGRQRHRREIEGIEAIAFDGFSELDQAELALRAKDGLAGTWRLMFALTKAQNNLQRIWVRVRLLRWHESRSEYVQVAGHLAAIIALTDDSYWAQLEPAVAVNHAEATAVAEAWRNLQAAARQVNSAELKSCLARMTAKIQPLADRIPKSAKSGSDSLTVSGFTVEQITTQIAKLETSAAADGTASASTQPAAPLEPPHSPQISADPGSSHAIDALLAANQWAEALKTCRRVQNALDDRDVGHFLYQYGVALHHTGQAAEAAVMFTRSALMYPENPSAARGLIQTAIVYRDEFGKPDTAKRLLQRALEHADARDQSADAMLARELLATFK
jgi:tetratricopeptide (TPR) repeat protein